MEGKGISMYICSTTYFSGLSNSIYGGIIVLFIQFYGSMQLSSSMPVIVVVCLFVLQIVNECMTLHCHVSWMRNQTPA